MNAKKIFKTILGVGTLVGTAYVAYKTGYQDGKDAKLPEKSENDEFDGTGDEDDDSDSDEDSDFLNDAEEIPCQPELEVPDISEETSHFKCFSEETSDFVNDTEEVSNISDETSCSKCFSDENPDFINDVEEISIEPESEFPDISKETSRFKRFSEIDIGDVFIGELIYALQIISRENYVFNKILRDYMRIRKEKADKILTVLENAGYISEKDNRFGRKVYINWEDYKKLYGCDAVQLSNL